MSSDALAPQHSGRTMAPAMLKTASVALTFQNTTVERRVSPPCVHPGRWVAASRQVRRAWIIHRRRAAGRASPALRGSVVAESDGKRKLRRSNFSCAVRFGEAFSVCARVCPRSSAMHRRPTFARENLPRAAPSNQACPARRSHTQRHDPVPAQCGAAPPPAAPPNARRP